MDYKRDSAEITPHICEFAPTLCDFVTFAC